jgi:hypothetical protein
VAQDTNSSVADQLDGRWCPSGEDSKIISSRGRKLLIWFDKRWLCVEGLAVIERLVGKRIEMLHGCLHGCLTKKHHNSCAWNSMAAGSKRSGS